MDLIRILQAQLAYGSYPLLDNAEFKIELGERVCIVGRNGAGKSSLLKVLSGEVILDSGEINQLRGLRLAKLEQDPPKGVAGTVFDYVAAGLPDIAQLLIDYHHLSLDIAVASDDSKLRKLANLQEQLDANNGWAFDTRISQVLTQLQLDGDALLSSLSGGWLRKVALARALVVDPQLLLLDEPTNHLDVESIRWLENYLKEFKGAIAFISHDRAFIRAMATRIVDLDRGKVSSFPGNYEAYLVAKEEALRVEEEQNALFDKRLAEEEVWIRQGIKARRTRNEGRVRALKRLREERNNRVDRLGTADLTIQSANRSSKLVFEAENVDFEYGNKTIVKQFSTIVMRGDRIGLVGPNGIGKTTLIKLLLGEIPGYRGKIRQGQNLEVAYFDQYRAMLDEEMSVQDNVADGKQDVTVGGRTRHVLGYLQDFLFPPARARTPVKALSGGEKNRLLLAKLFLKPSNILILDEPTNDLDVETLELLEEILGQYDGTVLVVSHDREFIDNVCSNVWCFEGNGKVVDIVGGFTEYQLYKSAQTLHSQEPKMRAVKVEEAKPTAAPTKSKKLSQKFVWELERLPQEIEQLELQIAAMQTTVNEPEFFKQDAVTMQAKLTELAQLEQQLEQRFERWQELEELKNSSN